MDNIRIIVVSMPASVRAYTICKDDYYTIVLNDNLSYEQRQKSYLHELQHIMNKDFEKQCSADLIECIAHS